MALVGEAFQRMACLEGPEVVLLQLMGEEERKEA